METLTGFVRQYALPVELLRLEITESAFSESSQQIVDVVKALVAYGFTVEIDDFGTGYSSLNTLKDVPAQIIKLDMRFLESSNSQRGGNIIESIVRMAKWLGMSVIAEGVETLEQADYLLSIGCGYVQGYLYAKPMPVEQYENYCSGAQKEERLLTLETVENLNNNTFWDPASMNTLIFNSYVGAACIFEYHEGNVELLRANRKFASLFGEHVMSAEDMLKLDWLSHLNDESRTLVRKIIQQSKETNEEYPGEYVFSNVPGCPAYIYLRATMRVIAKAGERLLVYCTSENITAQREAEQKERRIAAQMQIIMKNVNGGISAMSTDADGVPHTIFANDKYYSMVGYTKEQARLELPDIRTVVHPEDRGIASAAMEKLLRDHIPCENEYRCIKRDGSIIYVRSNKSIAGIDGYGDNVIISVLTDITDTVLAEQRARQIAAQLQAIMDNVDSGIVASTLQDGVLRFLFANDKFFEMRGYTREQYARQIQDPHSILDPTVRNQVKEETLAITNTGAPAVMEYEILRREGEKRMMRNAISIARFDGVDEPVQLSIFRDVTEEKRIQEREKRFSEQIQVILSDIDSGITATMVQNGRIEMLFSNDAFYSMRGYTRAQYRDEVADCYVRIHPDDRESIRRALAKAYGGAEEFRTEYRFLHRDGSQRWFRIALSCTRFTGIAETVALSIFTDITEEKMAQQQIRETSDQLRSMMDDMPGGFCRIRLNPDGPMTPVYVNDGLCKLTGMQHEEFMQHYADDALAGVHPDDAPIVKDAVSRMLANGEAHSSRYRLLQHDGGYIWLSIFGRVTNDMQGNTFLNIYYTDATAQVAEEQRQKELLDNLPCGAGIYEFRDGQMGLIYQNKSFWELVGLYEPSFPDAAPMSAVHPDDIPIIMQELPLAIRQNRDVSCDIRLRHLNMGYRHAHLLGRIVPEKNGAFRIYATFSPISDDEIAYQQMLPIALGAVMYSQTEYTFVKDKNLRYICCSPPMLSLMGCADNEAAHGKSDNELFAHSLAEAFYQADCSILENGEPVLDSIDRILSADGQDRYVCISKYPLRDSGGHVVGIFGVGRDVTETRKMRSQSELLTNSIPGGIATYAFFESGIIRIESCNDGFYTLFGGTREGYLRRGDFDPLTWVFEEDRPGLLKQVDALVHDDKPLDCVYRIHVRNGGYKWINQRAVVTERSAGKVLINAVLLDITLRQEAAERVRISEEEYRMAMQFSGVVVGRYSVANRTLSMSVEAAESNGHLPVIENVPYGQVDNGTIASKSERVYIEFFEEILRGNPRGKATFCLKLNGDWRWLEANFSTVYASDSKPISAIISFVDVTRQLEKETVYKKWQQSLDDKNPQAYTLFRFNLNNDVEYDGREGELLTFDFHDAGPGFSDRARAYARQMIYDDDRQRYTAIMNTDSLLANYYRGKRSYVLEYREYTQEGGIRWLRLSMDLVENPASDEIEAYLLYENIDTAKKIELQTKVLAESDPLTGVLNRSAFVARVNDALQASDPESRHALLMLDIDGFKRVNDVFGHGAGDQALLDIANGLRLSVRQGDFVGRLGGDEFVVFLGNIANDYAAAVTAKRICELAHRSFSMEVEISGSVGIAIAPLDGLRFEMLYKKTDAALYYVKGSGKNDFAFYRTDMKDEHLEPEPDPDGGSMSKSVLKKRRMLIVDDNAIDHALMQNIFRDAFIIEKAADGNAALIRLRHYGSAISVVLLDLMMPGMDGFAVLETMQNSAELRNIPILIVSGDESRDTCLKAIRKGATDFVTKPVDPEILRVRVHSAVSKAENERLRAKNSLLEVQNEERTKLESAIDVIGFTLIEFDWLKGDFLYYPSISKYLFGVYDTRPLWQILLSDLVADTNTVKRMQRLVHSVAESQLKTCGSIMIKLKTPRKVVHRFRMNVRKLLNEFQWTNKLIIALVDLDYEQADFGDGEAYDR